ncbi:hypothetical protein SARC_04808 [Sphaeroforma arctica JP610]|uniref:Uncharacterized protein n=1 Tax=Sphaeroforma arctica JP610 TaxID=667725 RepID=A0A0L0G250_9EUKA|nr:hypothetical protein SARC_04808 [Sphaeroforma arctica JP610]KNC82914.1 hypothetical protein SARC_04808 [Sphaeroforma arctica JP610]|eukprot:XP_014156816.1 hypothetical protein SARC_04808 [Sphaeroforma arctica JP610]
MSDLTEDRAVAEYDTKDDVTLHTSVSVVSHTYASTSVDNVGTHVLQQEVSRTTLTKSELVVPVAGIVAHEEDPVDTLMSEPASDHAVQEIVHEQSHANANTQADSHTQPDKRSSGVHETLEAHTQRSPKRVQDTVLAEKPNVGEHTAENDQVPGSVAQTIAADVNVNTHNDVQMNNASVHNAIHGRTGVAKSAQTAPNDTEMGLSAITTGYTTVHAEKRPHGEVESSTREPNTLPPGTETEKEPETETRKGKGALVEPKPTDTARTEGVQPTDGRLYRKLKEVQEAATSRALACCCWSRMKACCAPKDDDQDEFYEEIFDRMHQFLLQSMRDEFDLIVEETGGKAKLNNLEVLIDDAKARDQDATTPKAKRRRQVPDAETIIRSHMIPVKLSQIETLKSELAELREATAKQEKAIELEKQTVQALFRDVETKSESLTRVCRPTPTPKRERMYTWVWTGLQKGLNAHIEPHMLFQ